MRAHLLVAVLIIGIIAVPMLPQAHAATGTYFDNIVVIAMENRAYTEVIGSSNAPFINSMIPLSATLQHYNSYGAAGRTVNGCSAGCYTALVSGSDQGISDGYGCCISATTLMDRMGTAGLTWQAYCESGCPRGNDHFPFTGFASTASSPNVFTGSNVSPSDLIKAASSASPPNLLWYTPTDNNNMHDGSVSTGDAYIKNFLVGSGSLSIPAAGSLFASGIFQPGHRTLFLLWWDECAKGSFGCDSNNSTPNLWFGPLAGIKAGYSSTSTAYDEYSILHLIENNWALPTLATDDAAAAPMTEIFGSSTPPPLTTSFTTSPSTPIVNLPVTFTATTTGGKSPYTISWNFGDGSTGTGASFLHTFLTAQSFTVTETATDSSSPSQTATSSNTVTISPPPPLSTSFTFSPSSPTVNSQVTFTATTIGGTAPYSITWNFGDGKTGTGASIIHVYSSAQSFTVTETATDSSTPSQTATISQPVTVVPIPPLSSTFQVSSSSPQVGQIVTFTASATGGTSPYTYTIAFGDGGTGTGNPATHTYSAPGTYTANMTVMDSALPQARILGSILVNVQSLIPPTMSVPGNQTIVAGTWINFTITATSLNTGGTITFSATGLPAGASFNQATGLFSWKPSSTKPGSYTIVFTATDSSYPSTPTSKPMEIQVGQAAPGGSTGGNGGSGGSPNGSCTLCRIFPKISTNIGLLLVGGLLGLVASLALLTIRARASLERTKRRLRI